MYTLWKRPNAELLPSILIPAQFNSVLAGGADLPASCVKDCAPNLQKDQLVAVRQFTQRSPSTVSPHLQSAVWLWRLDNSQDLREKRSLSYTLGKTISGRWAPNLTRRRPRWLRRGGRRSGRRGHLFPVSSNAFYTAHVLPCRPAFPDLVLPPSGDPSNAGPRDISIKTSTHKSLVAFLKAAEKNGLLTLKTLPKNDVVITAVKSAHPDVVGHTAFLTVREEREAEKKAQAAARIVGLEKTDLYQPHHHTVPLCEEWGLSPEEPYSLSVVKAALDTWLTAHPEVVNPHDQASIALDTEATAAIRAAVYPPNKDGISDAPEIVHREQLLRDLINQMQPWHELKTADGERVTREPGVLKPVSVVQKNTGRKKAAKNIKTIITGLDLFRIVVPAEELALDLRRMYGNTALVTSDRKHKLLVQLQGKQANAIVEYLVKKGIPRQWIEAEDLVTPKEKVTKGDNGGIPLAKVPAL
ncbi:hypothetical protein BD626DRAFT_492853 [Schizophyllum amplum]|uniref:SUI1 domain-containing protein n=1 Tax=Schizophyllum amplum TaxID=97359 RepID=A0A550CGA3_9AGAR|nr:hypothetical protein BD626DRAFT_492853 [Auriculariopsis ampla]